MNYKFECVIKLFYNVTYVLLASTNTMLSLVTTSIIRLVMSRINITKIKRHYLSPRSGSLPCLLTLCDVISSTSDHSSISERQALHGIVGVATVAALDHVSLVARLEACLKAHDHTDTDSADWNNTYEYIVI